MSTRPGRSRIATRSYTARLRQTPVPRQRVRLRRTTWPTIAWLPAAWLPAALTLGAEMGHLATAITVWPASSARGVFHIVAGAVLGVVTVAAYPRGNRLERWVAAAVALAIPVASLAGVLAGISPYAGFPVVAAVAICAAELAAAALLALALAPLPASRRS